MNALVHRDYSTGVPIQIRVYENRIRFSNDGRLPDGWTLEKLLETHASKPSNPLLAGAFFRTGDIESWGRGIDKIREACTAGGTDFPTFDYEPTGLTVEFKAALPEDEEKARVKTPKNRGENRGEKLSENRRKILNAMRKDPAVSQAKLVKIVGISASNIENNIGSLKENGWIRRVGPAKGGHWEVIE